MQNEQPSTALAPVAQPQPLAINTSAHFAMALEPTNFQGALELANMMGAIRYAGVSGPEDALARIMFGRTLGMSAMASLANVFTIEGKPCLEASTMLGICLQRPDVCEFFEKVTSSATGATWRAKRRGHDKVLEVTFTIQDAERAGLTDRGKDDKAKSMNNWTRFPEDMCNARTITRVARQLFPDLIRGFASVEETRDEQRTRTIDVQVEVTKPGEQPAAVANANAGRDFRAEAEAFKAAVTATDTIEDAGERRAKLKELRDELAKHDGPNPHYADMKAHYNETVKRKTAASAPAEEPKGAS
jgi:hypothetical protein